MLHPQVTLSMSKELPVVVEYRISDIGHISCAPHYTQPPPWPLTDQCPCLPVNQRSHATEAGPRSRAWLSLASQRLTQALR